MKNLVFSMLILLGGSVLYAQQKTLKGRVVDATLKDNPGVFGASVQWLHTALGTSTDEDGVFEIPLTPKSKQLVISFVGFKTDTITVDNTLFLKHRLTPDALLEEVAVRSEKKASQRAFLEAQNVMTLNSGELLKAACCNLAESFETNPSIDVNFSDALTGAKQIQMLGLESPYLLITEENIPSIRGAAQAHGLEFTPGTWVESIQITKGAGSVVNGFESVSGQINTELVKPFTDAPFFVNAYGAVGGRYELNTHWNQQVAKKWHTGVYLHGDYRGNRFDRNDDGFLDNPLARQFNVLNRWQYIDQEKGWVAFANVHFVNDRKQLGQVEFDKELHRGTTTYWGSEIATRKVGLSTKLGYVFPDLPFQSMGVQLAYSNHRQDSFFGLRDYFIEHQSFYGSSNFNSIIGDTRHKFKTGLSFLYDNYKERVVQTNFNRYERAFGVFFEYAYDDGEFFSVKAGLRADFHNLLGTFLTPRLHFRMVTWENGVLRASVGQGRRSANVFAENQQLFASSRRIRIEQGPGKIYGLNPEIAWNYGVSFVQKYRLFGKKGDIGVDYYQTDFQNQVVVDWENPREVAFYNLDGRSDAKSLQIELNQNIIPFFNLRLAYKIIDVKTQYRSGLLRKALQPRNRFFANVSYSTPKTEQGAKWKFDVTYNWLGSQRLPSTASNPLISRRPDQVGGYQLVNAQITKVFSEQFEWYVGGENIGGVRQPNPILGAEDPFGSSFDSTLVYAPVFGSNFYTGIRFKLD
ncbi:TonB-dependent receptor [Tenacibaculum litopenaei]|uniref:TonB-dependent receptor n=1 Tax=Tenacibaculum litopenaei TaxID=396016 RepID=UPI003892EE79